MEQKNLKKKGQCKMQKYKFNIRKIEESEVEIQAKNKREALKKLLGFIAN